MKNIMDFSKFGGCGCKLSSSVLDNILESGFGHQEKLLAGVDDQDDAAVYQLNNEKYIVSTLDFFTPVVNDPFYFGKIAAANSISDIYAMGGNPIFALSILGFPEKEVSPSIIKEIVKGAKVTCNNAGITIAGGHTVNLQNMIFGLSVNGTVLPHKIIRNKLTESECRIFITKKIGVGFLSMAEQKQIITERAYEDLVNIASELNSFGKILGNSNCVSAMTDITGFGLLGHLSRMCRGTKLQIRLNFNNIPVIQSAYDFIEQCKTGGGKRNWESFKEYVTPVEGIQRDILCDPQTNGGLLIAVHKKHIDNFLLLAEEFKQEIYDIGCVEERKYGELIKID
ncbi:selenide, water dikinase SelD [Pasteurella skyensis]|uniref:Selenide, water dikinase n=1 Tax=Phocoenobacter skyensis TaxID=97481 RepID=A0AAJ6NZS6_9PAST|nr:selenide, water dikinase SelD [Pasteurella skyensis]MDP8161672.1 selenide, water dikinase SelD [Pasteurella skyensis]MDP8171828.1 selenide, water dikinase SelD [Pasteurella skyensis]MDP8176065.1 selenide, water dikinase SelD [Pasteurella skyensis]MDP8178083.1 selenide, water dikinase SelD [Pasteurella skyensis]MDP8182309.1 selenide, water dikinase SelD [Pasteurella skyensis]